MVIEYGNSCLDRIVHHKPEIGIVSKSKEVINFKVKVFFIFYKKLYALFKSIIILVK